MSEGPCAGLPDGRSDRDSRLVAQGFFVSGGITSTPKCALISTVVLKKTCLTADTTLRMAFRDRDMDRNTKDESNDGSVLIPLAVGCSSRVGDQE